MNYKVLTITAIASAAIGAGLSYKFLARETTKEIVKNHIVTQIRQVTNRDGTSSSETTIVDDSVRKYENAKIVPMPQWAVSGGARVFGTPAYDLGISRRLLGPVWLGVHANTDKQVSITASIEF